MKDRNDDVWDDSLLDDLNCLGCSEVNEIIEVVKIIREIYFVAGEMLSKRRMIYYCSVILSDKSIDLACEIDDVGGEGETTEVKLSLFFLV